MLDLAFGAAVDLLLMPLLVAFDLNRDRRLYWSAVRDAMTAYAPGNASSLAALLASARPYGDLADDDRLYERLAANMVARTTPGASSTPAELTRLIEREVAEITADSSYRYVANRRALALVARFVADKESRRHAPD
ncbi:MAG: hypothetical protein FDZ70_10385 [Actinobacteria bacterium]|nr:MAG: hypothetical protein FDZ70_10385 [Actinomycetota bacterium]